MNSEIERLAKGAGQKTGWPPGLLQDDDRRLSRWFASKPDARRVVRQNAKFALSGGEDAAK